MIYNYANGAPVLIDANAANAIFPAFLFNPGEVYFLYPAAADRIIYNYTLGVFFHQAGNGYQQIILPAVLPANMGILTGYTQANPNQLPTLYYANGRLTLQHGNCRNIGWHPRRANLTYVYGNILNPNVPIKKFEIGQQFNQALFNQEVAAVNAGNIDQSRLIELYYNAAGVIVSRHVSRSHLILGPVPNFAVNPVSLFLAAKEVNPAPF